jgi:hypothetical protein
MATVLNAGRRRTAKVSIETAGIVPSNRRGVERRNADRSDF